MCEVLSCSESQISANYCLKLTLLFWSSHCLRTQMWSHIARNTTNINQSVYLSVEKQCSEPVSDVISSLLCASPPVLQQIGAVIIVKLNCVWQISPQHRGHTLQSFSPGAPAILKQFRRNFVELAGKSKVKNQHLVHTLMVCHHAKKALNLSRDEKEEAFLVFLMMYTQMESKTDNNGPPSRAEWRSVTGRDQLHEAGLSVLAKTTKPCWHEDS